MPTPYTLGKAQRLKSRKSIERLFREGKSFLCGACKVIYRMAPLPEAAAGTKNHGELQAAFGVSARQFKKAVERNRIKRLMREAYRLRQAPLQGRLSNSRRQLELFFLYTGRALPDYKQVSAHIEKALAQLEKIIHETPATHT